MREELVALCENKKTAIYHEPVRLKLPKFLSDATQIAGKTWAELRQDAMSKTYQHQAWYKQLDIADQVTLAALR